MITTLATKRAVGYLRVSGASQTGERHSSLETQEARFHEHSERLGYLTVTTFVDVVSGRRDDRKEYNRMLDYVKVNNVEVIVVQFLDRFGRNPREILRRYWELEELGISVEATDEDIKDELLLLIKAGMAGAESKRTSERVRANMSRVVQKGVHVGREPYGLRRVYEGKEYHWEIDPTEASVVREMYALAVDENLGYKAIADRLAEKGYVGKEGRPFASYTIHHILNNEALVGTLSYGKKPRKGNPPQEVVRVPNFFPAILSEDEWHRLMERLSIRRESARGRTHASDYLLSGIARCGQCGGPMVGKVGALKKDGTRYRNYWCGRAMKSRSMCNTYNGHSAPRLEQTILEYLGKFSDPELVRKHIEAAEQRGVEQKEVELDEVTRGIAELESQFLRHLDLLKRDVLTEEEFSRANESIRGQKEALEERRRALKSWVDVQRERVSFAERTPKAIQSFIQDFEKMDVRVQKAHLQTILRAAHVYRDDRVELEFRG